LGDELGNLKPGRSAGRGPRVASAAGLTRCSSSRRAWLPHAAQSRRRPIPN